MSENTLQPIEQKDVLFYDDEITAVRVAAGDIYIPVKPLCEMMGVSWTGQRRRINRDAVLSEAIRSVNVTFTEPNRTRQIAMLCLPLDYISGFLFGINADRVKPEIKEKLIRYQRECYKVLNEAFIEGRLTANTTLDELLASDSPAAQAYRIATAIMQLARQQLLLESELEATKSQVLDNSKRLEAIESTLGDPGRHITPEQASQISQAVKAIAMVLSKQSGRNEYGGVYGELYRKFGIPSYRELPANKYSEAMGWLREWWQSLTDTAVPF